MTRLAETNVKAARDEALAETVADVVGLEVSVVDARIDAAHGRTRLDTLFAEEWPTDAADFEGKSAAWARDHGLDEELAGITGLTARTVRGRLKKASGRTHVQNVFSADWPEADLADEADDDAEAGAQLGLELNSVDECQNDEVTTSSSRGTTTMTTNTKTKTKKKSAAKKSAAKDAAPSGSLGFESKLWDTADVLRNNMDPAEYKHVVLGLIFLKYISDAFSERRDQLAASVADPESEDFVEDAAEREAELKFLLEERDEYTKKNVFWVPVEARWETIASGAKKPDIGQNIDAAMEAIEAENPALRGALEKRYGLQNLDAHNLGKLIDLIGTIGLGTAEHRAKDTLGRVYEYFLSRFASSEGKGGGEFYTPSSVVQLLVEMVEPYAGRVYDPCCGSGGMFVQSLKFIEAHDGQRHDISVYGQESNRTTWKMARMNLAIRGIEGKLGGKHADTFHDDQHPDLRADFILANPPFNISEWGGERLVDDARWRYGVPPKGNANYGWIQHMVHHLAEDGTAAFVLANGSMSSMSSGEGDIRQKLVEADLVDCIVACPGQLFYATQIPVCLWFLSKNKAGGAVKGATDGSAARRDRRGETLFIDARKVGRMENRVHRVFDAEHVAQVADTYHAWRNEAVEGAATYEDVAGFCKSATLDVISGHDFVLTPGRYVGAAEVEDDGEPFEEKMARLTEELWGQMAEGVELDGRIRAALGGLGSE